MHLREHRNLVLDQSQWRIQDFPEEGRQLPGGAPTYDFAIFSPKLYEIERIWAPGGAPPLDPPLNLIFTWLHSSE